MSLHPNSKFVDEPDFQALLVTCLEALQRGESIDRDALMKDFPQYADELERFLDDRRALEDATAHRSKFPSPRSAASAVEATVASAPAHDDFAIGDSIRYIGEYEVLEEIARGGMGVVFKARQQSLKRIVALKMILAGRLADAADVQRFQMEAQAAGRLKHPNIVPVHEVGEFDGRHYFTMDYIDGRSLSDEVRETSLAPKRAAELVRQVALAVHFAHQQGTLHRDLKPANVLLTDDDVPMVTDFGLAKFLDAVDEDTRTELTASGQILGTPSYMSPEQAAGKVKLVGPASDIYSLGAVLYACLTGRAPFVADSPLDTLLQVMHKDPVSPRLLNPSVPKDLETICLKCLQKETQRRYGSAKELADDLAYFLDGRPIAARPVGFITRTVKWIRRRPSLAATLAIAVVATTMLLAVWASMTVRIAQHRDFAVEQFRQRHQQLVNARLQEAEALRIAGNRSAALQTLRQVPRTLGRPDDQSPLRAEWASKVGDADDTFQVDSEWEHMLEERLRTLTIQTLITPGLELIREIPFGEVYRMQLSPDARYLAACGEYSFGNQAATLGENGEQYRTSLVVWDLRTGDLIAEKLIAPGGDAQRSVQPLSQGVQGVSQWSRFAFLPASDHLIAVHLQETREDSGQVVVWDPVTDETTHEFSSPEIAVTTDGQYIAQLQQREWLVEESQTGIKRGTLASGPVFGMQTNGLTVHSHDFRATNFITGEQTWASNGKFRVLLVDPRAEFCIATLGGAGSETATVRRVSDGSEVAELPHVRTGGKTGSVTPFHFRFSPDGNRLAYQTDLPPAVVGIWSLKQNQLEALVPGSVSFDFGQTSESKSSSFSPDGRLLAIFSHAESSTMRLWDLAKRDAIGTVEGFGLEWSDDGHWLAGVYDPGHKLPNEPTNPASAHSGSHGRIVKVWQVLHPPSQSFLAESAGTLLFDSDGDRLIANDHMLAFDGEKLTALDADVAFPETPELHTGRVQDRAIRFDQQDRVWQFQLPTTPFHEEPLAFTFTGRRDWGILPVPDFTNQGFWRWTAPGQSDTGISAVTIAPRMVALSFDGSRLAVAAQLNRRSTPQLLGYSTASGEVVLLRYDLSAGPTNVTNDPKEAYEWGRDLRCLALSPDGELIATTHAHQLKVRRWLDGQAVGQADVITRWTSDVELVSGWEQKSSSGELGSWEYANLFDIRCLCFSTDSTHIVAGAEAGRMIIADRMANIIADWQAHDSDVMTVAVNPRVQMLVSGDADGRIRLWDSTAADSASGVQLLADWSAHSSAITAVAFDPAGRFVITGATGGEVTAWDLNRIRDGLLKMKVEWKQPSLR